MLAARCLPLGSARAGWVWGTRRSFSAMEAASSPAAAALPPPPLAAAAAPAAAALFRACAPPAPGTRAKGKNHFKRASEVMAAVREDAIARTFVKMAAFRPPLPDFRVGDAVEVLYAQELAEAKPLAVKGTVMSMPRKGIDAKFTIINVRCWLPGRGCSSTTLPHAAAPPPYPRLLLPPPHHPTPRRTWTGSGT
jgi:hypothetical protein